MSKKLICGIDLSLAKRLFNEFEETLKLAESYKNDGKIEEVLVEQSRALGLIGTLAQETALLYTDLTVAQKTLMGGAPLQDLSSAKVVSLNDLLPEIKSKSNSTKN